MGAPLGNKNASKGGDGGTTRAGYQKGSKGGSIVKVNPNNIGKFKANGVNVKLGQKIKFKHSK